MGKGQTYVFELGCEEIPARFVDALLASLQHEMERAMTRLKMSWDQVSVKGTARRLSVLVTGLPAGQSDRVEEIKGPPLRIAKASDGGWTPAAVGFAKKVNLSVEDLAVKSYDGAEYLVASVTYVGNATSDVLEEMMPHVLGALSLPVTMKWGEGDARFVRPVHWMMSLLDQQVVSFSFAGVTAGQKTYGHRFLTENEESEWCASGVAVLVPSAADYESMLQDVFVILDQEKRKSMIVEALEAQGQVVGSWDPALVEEVCYLVEWPTFLVGRFDSLFLSLPHEPLVQCMKKHQKFFPLLKDDVLQGEFLIVADNVTENSRDNIVRGNEQVLRARLEDVQFFWNEDKKKTLDEWNEALHRVVFQKGLGTIAQRVERFGALSSYLVTVLGCESQRSVVQDIVQYSKSDLASLMVSEMPALQGVMGRLYAVEQGLSDAVASGVASYYYPRFSGDQIPEDRAAQIVSIADKCDMVVSCFYNDLIPSGSHDPWGLRRVVLGIAQVMMSASLALDITKMVDQAYQGLVDQGFSKDFSENREALFTFWVQRLKQSFLDQGLAHDGVEALSGGLLTDLVGGYAKICEIETYRKSSPDRFKQVVDTGVRVGRLAAKLSEKREVDLALFQEVRERESYEAFQAVKGGRLDELYSLSQVMAAYFEQVLVMHEDEKIRINRLSFLCEVSRLFESIVGRSDAYVV